MFKSFSFENFRVFKNIKIEPISRINLFFGENNSGKTSVLEAIFLLLGMTKPDLLANINFARGFSSIKDFSYFFHDFDTSKSFVLESFGDIDIFDRRYEVRARQMTENKVRLSDETVDSDASALITNRQEMNHFELRLRHGKNTNMTASGSLTNDGKAEQLSINMGKKYEEKIKSIYIAPSSSTKNFIPLLSNIITYKNDKLLLDALRCVDKRINEFKTFHTDIMIDIGLDRLLPLNLSGDGTKKAFNIMTALCSCQDGVLIIDEIDNGLHFSVMKDLLDLIIKTARMFNVQVFMTTHNIDLINAMSDILSENPETGSEVSAYNIMRRDNGEHKALYYDSESFCKLIEMENEIR